jgi:hypothetical protein
MFIRREFDTQAGTINVLNLLSEVQKRPQVLRRRRFRQFFDALAIPEYAKDGLANDYFNRFNIVGVPAEVLGARLGARRPCGIDSRLAWTESMCLWRT